MNGDGKGLGAALGGVCYRVVPHHDDLAEIKHIEFHEAFLPCRNFEKFPKTLQKSFRELSPFEGHQVRDWGSSMRVFISLMKEARGTPSKIR